MAVNGYRFDRMEFDELGADGRPETEPRRELIAIRPDGTTYSLAFPADWDLGQALPASDIIGFDTEG